MAVLGSKLGEVTLAVLLTEFLPLVETLTVTVMLTAAPLAMVPNDQEAVPTDPAGGPEKPEPVALTNVQFAGTGSLTRTSRAGPGPLFTTRRV